MTCSTGTNEKIPVKVRNDRIGLYDHYGIWRYMPLPQEPSYGDLWLTEDGLVGFDGVGMAGKHWQLPLSDIRNVHVPDASVWWTCARGARRSTSLEADFIEGKSYIVNFTGITHLMQGAERLGAHVPYVNIAVALKSGYDNRGTKARAKEALDLWMRLLRGELAPKDLAALSAGGTAAS